VSTGIPQGSVLGPLLFALNVPPVGNVVHSLDSNIDQCADVLKLYIAVVRYMYDDLAFIVRCAGAVSSWFAQNVLLLNPDKAEAVILEIRQRLANLSRYRHRWFNVRLNNSLKLFGVIHSMQLTHLSPTLSRPAPLIPGRCVTSGRSLPLRQLRLLLPQSSEEGLTTATASCLVQWTGYSECRTTWHVSSCRQVLRSCSKSCIAFPQDNEVAALTFKAKKTLATDVAEQPLT